MRELTNMELHQVGGVAGAAVGLAAGLIVGTGAYLPTKDGPESTSSSTSTADE